MNFGTAVKGIVDGDILSSTHGWHWVEHPDLGSWNVSVLLKTWVYKMISCNALLSRLLFPQLEPDSLSWIKLHLVGKRSNCTPGAVHLARARG